MGLVGRRGTQVNKHPSNELLQEVGFDDAKALEYTSSGTDDMRRDDIV